MSIDLRTYRATTIQEALQLVRRDLGPDASVLHTREIKPRLLGLWGTRQIEVVASNEVSAPSRLPQLNRAANPPLQAGEFRNDDDDVQSSNEPVSAELALPSGERMYVQDDGLEFPSDAASVLPVPLSPAALSLESASLEPASLEMETMGAVSFESMPPAHEIDYRSKFRDDLKKRFDGLHSCLEDLCDQVHRRSLDPTRLDVEHLTGLLLDRQFNKDIAAELVEKFRHSCHEFSWDSETLALEHLERILEGEIPDTRPIRAVSGGRRIVALVGPTGVGKTTTIAKLAALFHLREKRRVGLVTVDTYRIAAVEQLRTYAEIIDLPMEVVSTPKEMRRAIASLSDCELVLIDTAGRSPRDDLKIQELRVHLSEANADEVHLVLSCVASEASILESARRFGDVGASALILTKLDESLGLGSLIPLFRQSRLPVSYLTDGQDVPHDLEPADRPRLKRRILQIDDPSM